MNAQREFKDSLRGARVIAPEDALLIFNKWKSEGTLVFCTSSLYSCWGLALRGHVTEASRDGVRLETPDRLASVAFRPLETDGFEYGESGHAFAEVRDATSVEFREQSTLVVGLPSRVTVPKRPSDKLIFLELPDEQP
jgi:hypothetical protein